MIVIPIQFIIALALAGIGVILLFVVHMASCIHNAIIKWRRKHSQNGDKE